MTSTRTRARRAQAVLEYIDPATLIVAANVRSNGEVDAGLKASITEHGVLQAVTGWRDGEGVHVTMGKRRTLAAAAARVADIPVMVYPDAESAQAAQDADRIVTQLSENLHREALPAADEAAAVQELLDLGITAGQITRRVPRLGPDAIERARRVAASERARAAAAEHHLDLETSAAVAEFEDDDDAVGQLVEAAREGRGAFAHAVQELRDERASQAAWAAAAAQLEADHVTLIERRLSWDNRLSELAGADGQAMTEAEHAQCPGHVAFLEQYWDDGRVEWRPVFYCADPRANKHKALHGRGAAAKDAEQASAERRQVIALNRKWRSATEVRHAWLRELAQRKTPPKGALRVILEAVARHDAPMLSSSWKYNELGVGLLGMAEPADSSGGVITGRTGQERVLAAIAEAGDARAQVITLMLILAAYETRLAVSTWRGAWDESARYLHAIAGWGYMLAPIEQVAAGDLKAGDVPATDASAGEGS